MGIRTIQTVVLTCDFVSSGDGTDKGLISSPRCGIELRLTTGTATAWEMAEEMNWLRVTSKRVLCPVHSGRGIPRDVPTPSEINALSPGRVRKA